MNLAPDNGGPAFPVVYDGCPLYSGMTMRDYFAAHATDEDVDAHRTVTLADDGEYQYDVSREVAKYRYADAMIAAGAS